MGDVQLTTKHDSASRWVADFLDKRMRAVLADVVRAGKDLENLENQALQFCIRICEIEELRRSVVREVKQQVAEDRATYGSISTL